MKAAIVLHFTISKKNVLYRVEKAGTSMEARAPISFTKYMLRADLGSMTKKTLKSSNPSVRELKIASERFALGLGSKTHTNVVVPMWHEIGGKFLGLCTVLRA